MILQQKFSRYLCYAFVLHLLFLGCFLSMGRKMGSSDFLIKNAEILQTAVKVDVVAMPTLSLSELKSMEMVEETKGLEEKVPTQEPQTVEYKKKSDSINVDKILKAQAGKSVAIKPIPPSTEEKKVGKIKLQDIVLAGNKISKGTALTGEINSQVSGEFAGYAMQIPDLVRPFWKLPNSLLEKDLTCRVRIFIGSDGTLLRAIISESSGNTEYDQRALSAVYRVEKFPAPGIKILPRAKRGDIILGFPI